MSKLDKAIIKLLGMIAAQLVVIATNLSINNGIKINEGARKTNIVKDNSRVMKSNLDSIDEIIKEAIDG